MNETEALDAMHEAAPNEWWRFVVCGYCNARRQVPCQGPMGPARDVHARRYWAGVALHGTLWLIRNGYEADVLKGDA